MIEVRYPDYEIINPNSMISPSPSVCRRPGKWLNNHIMTWTWVAVHDLALAAIVRKHRADAHLAHAGILIRNYHFLGCEPLAHGKARQLTHDKAIRGACELNHE